MDGGNRSTLRYQQQVVVPNLLFSQELGTG